MQPLVDAHEQRQAGCQIAIDAPHLTCLPAGIGASSETAEDFARLGISKVPAGKQVHNRPRHGGSFGRRDLGTLGRGIGSGQFVQHDLTSWRKIGILMPFGKSEHKSSCLTTTRQLGAAIRKRPFLLRFPGESRGP